MSQMTPRTQVILASAAATILIMLFTIMVKTCQVERPHRASVRGGERDSSEDDYSVRLFPPVEVPLPVVRNKRD